MTENREAAAETIRRALPGRSSDDPALNALAALVAELEAARAEIERLSNRAVCSGCGQDTDEGGVCHTDGCDIGEMIPASDLPGALRDLMERLNAERAEWREDWEQLRAEANALEARVREAAEAFQAILDVPFDVTRSPYKDAADIAAAALASLRGETP